MGSEAVVRCIIAYEKEAVGKVSEIHDQLLTQIIKAIRKDLKIKDKHYPDVSLRK
jgi:hydroxymethylpyrimidine/phosphomethylpyrimidine kinase